MSLGIRLLEPDRLCTSHVLHLQPSGYDTSPTLYKLCELAARVQFWMKPAVAEDWEWGYRYGLQLVPRPFLVGGVRKVMGTKLLCLVSRGHTPFHKRLVNSVIAVCCPRPALWSAVQSQRTILSHECCYHNFNRKLQGVNQLGNHKQLLCQYFQN